MTPGEDDSGGATPPGPGEDLGAPIAELRDVQAPLADRFSSRVRHRLERRMFAGDALELLWTAPLTMLIEFLRWPFDGRSGPRK